MLIPLHRYEAKKVRFQKLKCLVQIVDEFTHFLFWLLEHQSGMDFKLLYGIHPMCEAKLDSV